MTRPTQKQRERAVVDHYLKAMGIAGVVEDGPEPPDFLVRAESKIIGVEVTEYHQPLRTAGGYTRREVEAAWAKIREYVVDFRKTVSELDKLSVGLQFVALSVPSTQEITPFVRAITDKIRAARSSIDRKVRYLQTVDTDPPILRKYLKSIRVRNANCYMEWDWNHDFAGIGTSDDEMVLAIGAKLRSYKPVTGSMKATLSLQGGVDCCHRLQRRYTRRN